MLELVGNFGDFSENLIRIKSWDRVEFSQRKLLGFYGDRRISRFPKI